MRQVIGLSLVAMCWSTVVSGQQPVRDAAPVLQPVADPIFQPPVAGPSRAPELADLVLAKVDIREAGPRVIMMIESYRTEKKTVMVNRMVPQNRERTIVVDGEEQVQDYSVFKSVVEAREIDVAVPAGPKPKTVDVAKLRFYGLDGKQISIDQVAENLSSLRPIFLLDQHAGPPRPLSEVAQRALRATCVIAVTEGRVRDNQATGPTRRGVPVPAPIVP
jgi:hypothetical protein